jgi:hypothetical protein
MFLFGGIFGLGNIAADHGRSVLYDVPLSLLETPLAVAVLLYAVYISIWVGWRLYVRKADRSKLADT